MTWRYRPDGTDLNVWDHTQDPSADSPYHTETNAGGWSDGTPFESILLDIMHDEAQSAVQNRDIERAVNIVLDGAFRQIERVKSDG